MVFKKIDKKLRQNVWQLVRVNGSHHMYKHVDNPNCLSVPDHGKESISTGVIKSIERLSGLSLR